MKESIKLSIIIPIFNMQDYLSQCFSSIEKQAWSDKDVEIICIDDGSTDNSLSICEEHAKKYPYIKVYSKENGGVSSARNFGINKANGDYIYWIDPDDYIGENFYLSIKDILFEGYDLIFFDLITLYPNGKSISCEYGNKSTSIDCKTYIKQCCDSMLNTRPLCIKIVKTQYWKEVGFKDDISYAEDYQAWTHILMRLRSIYYLHKKLYFYRMHNNSICHNVSIDEIMRAFCLVQERCDFFAKRDNKITHIGEGATACMLLQEMINLSMRITEKNAKYDQYYHILLKSLKKYKYELLLAKDFPVKSKIRMLLLLANLTFALKYIKNFLDYIREQ